MYRIVNLANGWFSRPFRNKVDAEAVMVYLIANAKAAGDTKARYELYVS